MLRALLSAVVLAMTAVPVATDANCGNAYGKFLARISQRGETITSDRLARLHRKALRIYDACDAGHMDAAEAMFRELE